MSASANIYTEIDVAPIAPYLGAEVRGVNLADGVTDEQLADIRRAFLQFQVLFFKDQQKLAPQAHIDFARHFGVLHAHPAAPTMPGYPEIFEIHTHRNSKVANGNFWHSDVSCDEMPPSGTMLQLHVLPSRGGDTLFNNMYAAYESLPPVMRKAIRQLTATHESAHVYKGRYSDRGQKDSAIDCPTAVHPVVRTHPQTGRRALYVNRTFTTMINELAPAESASLLGTLFAHAEEPRFQIRFHWAKNDLAFWDNRCCMHHAIWDYWPEERKGRRVTISGDRPV